MGGRERSPEAAPDLVELHGWHAVLEAVRARRRRLVRLQVRQGLRHAKLPLLEQAAAAAGLPLEEVPAEVIAASAPPGVQTQGLALLAGPLPEIPLAELARGAQPRTLVALDGVEDPQNVGAIARAAECAGAAGLVLTRRHAPPLGSAVSRASAGAIEWLPVARVPNLPRALRELQGLGFWAFGLDAGAGDDLFALPPRVRSGDRVLVLGAEGRGLRPGVVRVLDHRVRIPLRGRIDSLNVAVAAAVALFELAPRAAGGPPGPRPERSPGGPRPPAEVAKTEGLPRG
jgi:23S rRNA (guanosine2251-2'-O)-methyltransferase